MLSRKNFFVVGDLIIDHAVFVEPPDYDSEPAEGETTYKVVRRQNTVGGAANTARILAALYPHGKTYLWGILGGSHWGTVRQILEASQALDGTLNNIELRGVQDETDGAMNTITRLVRTDAPMHRVVRFDDLGHVHVADSKRETLGYHLRAIHAKHRLDAVIINDLDRGCLTPALTSQIAEFAAQENVPLFVDPKRVREKYRTIKGTAILPNLREWCHLVDDAARASWWRDNLAKRNALVEMAERSFHYLGTFQYHVIKCDEDGAIIIAPEVDKPNRYAIYLAPPELARLNPVKDPLGPGDVMAGVIAAEYDSVAGTRSLLRAFQRANVAVACYREMAYQRMPSKDTVEERQRDIVPWSLGPAAETTKGALFLPKETSVSVGKLSTTVPGLVSADAVFKDQVARLIEALRTGTDSSRPPSIMLAAPSGSGKTRIAQALEGNLGAELGLTVQDIKLEDIVSDPEKFLDDRRSRNSRAGLLFIVDEALKMGNGAILKDRARMVPLLNMAEARRARFLLMDALFSEPSHLDGIHQEIRSRCELHVLPGLEERPEDIAHVLGALILEAKASQQTLEVIVEREVLRAVIDKMLSAGGNVRTLHKLVESIHERALAEHKGGTTLRVTKNHLPSDLPAADWGRPVGPPEYVYER